MSFPTRVCAILFACITSISAAWAQSGTRQAKPLDPANLDTTCAACTNFYQFANGGWMRRNPIPAVYSEWGSFSELGHQNTEALHSLLEQMAAHPAAESDPAVRKLAEFYASCMDTVAIERQGATPLLGDLMAINAIQTAAQVRQYLISIHARGMNQVFNFGSIQDAKNSSEVIGAIQQGGLGLPDRDYYLNNDSGSVALRNSYVQHVAKSLVLTGESAMQADSDAKRILVLETALANASFTQVQLRDPDLNYHRKTLFQVMVLAPHLSWNAYFAAQNIPGIVAVNVMQPKFLAAADSLLNAAPVASWRAYFRWHLVRAMAGTLSKAFVNEDFMFNQKITGAKELLPRYRRCTIAADGTMGEALGKAYVQRYFTSAAKARALEMLKNLKAAFRERLATRTWMSDSTRNQAYAKLDAFMDKIGYPDKWKDYWRLDIKPGRSYYENSWATLDFVNRDDIWKIGKPLDRTIWGMSTPTVNAYYNPPMNEIVFPAGILQPPFFDPNADDAVNYGGMGAVMGHELTHGFDDQGAQYDEDGNLRQWFTDADLKLFHDRTKAVETQFDGYTVLDSLHVNGKLTLGENIADLGGVLIAYTALEKSLQGKPRPPDIDGFTPEQRFFLAWAQMWRTNIRPELERLRVKTNPHSPQIWRTNGPLSNLPEFAKAWGCREGDPMVRPPAVRADIW